jgi:hypothetical protein
LVCSWCSLFIVPCSTLLFMFFLFRISIPPF